MSSRKRTALAILCLAAVMLFTAPVFAADAPLNGFSRTCNASVRPSAEPGRPSAGSVSDRPLGLAGVPAPEGPAGSRSMLRGRAPVCCRTGRRQGPSLVRRDAPGTQMETDAFSPYRLS